MTVAALQLANGTEHQIAGDVALPPAFRELAAVGVMASAPEPFDLMEKAFRALAADDLRKGETLPGEGRTLIRSYPLSPIFWQSRRSGRPVMALQLPPKARPGRLPICANWIQISARLSRRNWARWPLVACACWGWRGLLACEARPARGADRVCLSPSGPRRSVRPVARLGARRGGRLSGSRCSGRHDHR